MKFVMKVLSMIAVAAVSTAGSGSASASGVVAGATLPEQLVQEITLVQQYSEQMTQTAQQIQMVENQARNLINLPAQMWQSMTAPLQQLVQVVGNAQGLSYAAQNTVAQITSTFGKPNVALSNYGASLAQWTSNVNSQIGAVLQQYGLASSNFQTTQQALASIQAASQSATGRMQVLQAGNQIAGLMVNQLQSLQADIQAGNQAEMNFMAMQANAKAHENDDLNNWRLMRPVLQP